MKEMIKKSLGFWNNYWGDSVFPYLLAIALLYLLIFKRKKKTTRYVLGYVFLALFLFFFRSGKKSSRFSTEIFRDCRALS